MMKKLSVLLALGLSLLTMVYSQASDVQVKDILASSEPPVGVVFEVAGFEDNGFDWAAPVLKSYAKQLRAKFPGIKLAVVSHGLEQFQLTQENRQEHAVTHNKVRSLVKESGIEVHVCGNFASMMDVGRDEFVDFVKVAGRAPLQIEEFKQVGYKLVIVKNPN